MRRETDLEQPDRSSEPSTRRSNGTARSKAKRNGSGQREDRQTLLLEAARSEFATRGLAGARVDTIAERSGANKQLVYHYFGSKDGLYLAVLENAYQRFAGHFSGLELHTGSASQRLTKYIELLFDSLHLDHEFLALVTDQNLQSGRHIKQSRAVRSILSPLTEQLAGILQQARKEKTLKLDMEATDLYLNIAGICAFYFTNSSTLSAAFGRQFDAKATIAERRKHIVEFILSALFLGNR